MTALQHVQELDQSADVFLYYLSNYSVANPKAEFRFTSMSGVSFGGPFQALACSIETLEISSTGAQSRPVLTMSDTAGIVGTLLGNTDGIEGSKLRVVRTKARYLDSGQTPSVANGILQRSDLVVSRISNWIPLDSIALELSSVLDYGGGETACPARNCNIGCGVPYRSAACSYAGAAMFTLAGQPTLDPTQDRCAKTLSACKLRFGQNATLPYAGFPTVQRR